MGRDAQMLTVHGSGMNDFALLLDGFPQMIFYTGIPGVQGVMPADGLNEEVNVLSGGNPAEADSGGVRVNLVPKSGGNVFRGDMVANFAHRGLSWDNLTPALVQQLRIPENKAIDYLSDVNPTVGGPVLRDRLWYFASFRDTQASNRTIWLPDLNPNDWVYTPDTSRDPGSDERPVRNLNGRLTWAVSPRNKLNFSVDVSKGLHGAGNLGLSQVSPEAWVSFHYRKKPGTQVTWNAPLTSRLLLEAGGEFDNNTVGNIPAFPTAVTPGATEQSSNLRFRAQLGGFATTDYLHHQANYRFLRGAASYVTGSHALKVGLQLMPASATTTYDLLNGGPAYYVTLLNGAPRSVTYLATPRTQEVSNVILGLYGQDQWTLRRLTVNAGLRFDSMNAGYPDARHAPTPILPPIDVPGQTVLKWRDVSPRIGVAYDLFGTGKTAVKASVNRYIIPELAHGRVLTQGLQAGGGFTLSRTWNDATGCAGCVNGDFVPQGDPLNPATNGELGPSPNRFFGQAFVTNRFDSEWAHGWGVRPFNWEMSASLQHQLADGVGANVGYFRRLDGNFVVTDNLAVSPEDYDPFCVTAPADSRFPTAGGQQICGLFDLNPAKVGQQDVITTRSSNYGKQLERFNGVDASIDMRLRGGVFLRGGWSGGARMTDNCDVVGKIDNPSTWNCHQEQGLLSQIKLFGAYRLAWGGVDIAATYQDMVGGDNGLGFGVAANTVYTNAQVRDSLNRNLSSGVNGTVSVNVIEPGSLYLPRLRNLDLRFAKTVGSPVRQLKVILDIFNTLNTSTLNIVNNTYSGSGQNWLSALRITPGRFLKLGLQLKF